GSILGFITAFIPDVIITLTSLILCYIVTLFVAAYKFKMGFKRVSYTKGAMTFIIAWFLILILTYNIIV
ncbi:MAG: hypothetical protein QXY37_00135, partial [Metallosphaera sp.]